MCNFLQINILFLFAILFGSCAPEPETVDTTIEDSVINSDRASQDHSDQSEVLTLPTEQVLTSQFTTEQARLLEAYEELNSKCRGPYSADTDKHCAKRDSFYQKMRPANLCRGKESDEAEYQMEWHVCNRDSLNFRGLDNAVNKGRCRLKLEGDIIIDGKCSFKINYGGGFWIKSPDEKIFALVYESDVNKAALVSIAGRNIMDDGDLGIVERDGACWSNAIIEICAWE